METNLRNMPKDVVYQFSENQYVWKRDRYQTRNGNYSSDTPTTTTEIFTIDGLGEVRCDWSGGLTDNPYLYGENGLNSENCFHIFSWDQDCGASFKQTMPLKVAPQEIQDGVLAIEPEVFRK
jgi:hypothetical protein